MNEDPKIIAERWAKKKESIRTLNENIRKLRYNVSVDLKSDDSKVFLTALVVAIMCSTYERVGNSTSEENNHLGVTGFRKDNVKINGNTITLQYVGKSGVEHTKTFTNEKIANGLKRAIKESPSGRVFTTPDGFDIKNDRITRYVDGFNITPKDIRGFGANELILKRLNSIDIIEQTEYKRKRQFTTHMKYVAGKLGHGAGTLRKHYVLPEIVDTFLIKGEVFDMETLPAFEKGGDVVASTASASEKEPVVSKKPLSAFKILFGFDFND